MKEIKKIKNLSWTIVSPIIGWALYFSALMQGSGLFQIAGGFVLVMCVLAAVHHSEIVAHKVGEPYGTIILAIAITVIEVAIIISLMVEGGAEATALARDTVFAATMLILNGIIGACIMLGGAKFHEQVFSQDSANTALVSLVAIIIFTLILPNYTTSIDGPSYSQAQLLFVAVACLVIYGGFLLTQTVRHREYFLEEPDDEPSSHTKKVSLKTALISLVFLILCLGIVVLLAKTLSPTIERIIISAHLPNSLVGVIIASIVLLPECIAAIKAARKNRLQTSLNLALGSALASIGLTIPCVVVACRLFDLDLVLGLDMKSTVLLALSVFIVMLSLNKGKTNMLYGIVLLVNVLAYLFIIIYP